MRTLEVFAPGCIGNIGPGLDILGLAVTGPGDAVTAALSDRPGVVILDPGHPNLSRDPALHTAGIAARAVLKRAGEISRGVELRVRKGLPLAGGQGGSAASAVAAAVAVNSLLGSPLGLTELLASCLEAEEAVAGRHLDNIAPALMGGAVLIRSLEPVDVVPLSVRSGLTIVLAHPELELETRRGRAALPVTVDRSDALYQAAQVAGIVAALGSGDWELLGRSIDDRIAEPARAPLLPGFREAKDAALAAGALGCSISGSGPTAFAFARDAASGEMIRQAMIQGYARAGIRSSARLASVDTQGVRIRGSEQPVAAGSGIFVPDGVQLKLLFRSRLGARGPLGSGVWRYRELVLPQIEDPVSHPEGNTPLLRRDPINAWAGADHLLVKHEGHNPTGSFKDRGMTVGMTEARRLGAKSVACASTGNTAASMAAYAAQAGIPAMVLVPAGQIALSKLGQSLAYGARVLLVRGDFDDCLRLVREAEASLGVYLLNSINPLRLAGQKTIIFELLEQLDWNPPDWIVFPAGNLGNTAAFGMALSQARSLGLIGRTPRLAAVQAAGAAPFYRSFQEGFAQRYQVKAETIATAIRIGDPASFELGREAIQATDGVVESVADEEILLAKSVVDSAGVGCEPASAASVAGVRKLVARGVIQPGDRVVAILTGHLLKDPATTSGTNRPVEIEATLTAVEQAMGL